MKWVPNRKKYIEVLSKTVKAVKELNEDIPIKISLKSVEGILELLKEQEAVRPTADDTESIKPYAQGDGSYACNNCGETVGWEEMNCGGISLVKYKYCPECGRRIRWNG